MWSKNNLILFSIISLLLVIISCEKITPKAPESSEVLAEPLSSLTNEQLAIHLAGDELFAKVYGIHDGLGPIFIQAACENCHNGDGKGTPVNKFTRFGKYDANGIWDKMLSVGGPQLQHRAITGFEPESLPENAKKTELIALNVTGLGYFEYIEDQYLIDIRNEQLQSGLVSGELNYITPPDYFQPSGSNIANNGKYIGRFGRKSSSINLQHRVVEALKQDMGITSPYDTQDPLNFSSSGLISDNVADPEVSANVVNNLVFYLATLREPIRRNTDDADVKSGEAIFYKIGCNNCHRPTMKTGNSPIQALNNVEFHPYTDLLLHEMGKDLDDGYTEGSVQTGEWRTPPLWGLGLQIDSQGGEMYLLHDGRAKSYHEAIQFHGGEAESKKLAYNSLTDSEKQLLIKFLNSL